MQRLTDQILAYAQSLSEAQPIAAKGLLHLGKRAALDQALSSLTARGHLIRAGRGIYFRPIAGRFGPRMPSLGSIVEALAKQRGEMIIPSGAAAANMSDQNGLPGLTIMQLRITFYSVSQEV